MTAPSPSPPIHRADGNGTLPEERVLNELAGELEPSAEAVARIVAGALAGKSSPAARRRQPTLRRPGRLLVGLSAAAAVLLLTIAVWSVRQPPPPTPTAPATLAVGELVLHLDPDGVSTIRSQRSNTTADARSGLLIALTWIQPSQQP